MLLPSRHFFGIFIPPTRWIPSCTDKQDDKKEIPASHRVTPEKTKPVFGFIGICMWASRLGEWEDYDRMEGCIAL